MWLECPYLGGQVELTGERQLHIARWHRAVVAVGLAVLANVLADPDVVGRRAYDRDELAFARVFGAEHLVVVVRSERGARSVTLRHWVVTAYMTRSLDSWVVEWER